MVEYSCVYIDNNEISEKGCRYLSKAAWRELEVMALSNYSFTQTGIKSVTGAAR